MEDKKEILCRLCLNFISSDDSETLDIIEKNVLQEIIPELDLDISDDPKICQSCNKIMLVSYEFRNRNNTRLLNSVAEVEENSAVNYIQIEENGKHCEFCMSSINEEVFVEFNPQKKYFREILEKCVPEWSMVRKEESVPCKNCLEALKNQFAFISTCQNTEKQINKYCLTRGTNSKGKINLYEALQFILASETKPSVAHFMSVNKNENEDCNFVLKTEDVEIKSEEYEDCTRYKTGDVEIKSEEYEHCTKYKTEDVEIKSEEYEEELSEVPSSSQLNQVEASTQGEEIQSKLLEMSTAQVPQNTVRCIIADGDMFFQPTTTIQNIVKIPKERKRPSPIQKEASIAKQQKIRIRQDLTSDDVPEKRSVGVQVIIDDLIQRCSVGIQVSPGDINTRTLGINAKPDTSDKQVSCRPRSLYPTAAVERVIRNVERIFEFQDNKPKKTRKGRKRAKRN